MAFRFLRFKVYHDAKELHRVIVFLTKSYPREFLYLKDQLRRSSLSIALSVAEGSAKATDKDFHRYVGIALGSANETGAGLDISVTEKLVRADDAKKALKLCKEIIDQLGGLSKTLSK